LIVKSQGSFELSAGAFMGWDFHDKLRDGLSAFQPKPGENCQADHYQDCQRPPQPGETAGNIYWRRDVADVRGVGD
jgi:hypothetical protein